MGLTLLFCMQIYIVEPRHKLNQKSPCKGGIDKCFQQNQRILEVFRLKAIA